MYEQQLPVATKSQSLIYYAQQYTQKRNVTFLILIFVT